MDLEKIYHSGILLCIKALSRLQSLKERKTGARATGNAIMDAIIVDGIHSSLGKSSFSSTLLFLYLSILQLRVS